MPPIDLQYDPASFAGKFDARRVSAFTRWLNRANGTKIAFGPDYLAYLRKYHGGIPGRRYFRTRKGTGHVIVRFLNFLSDSDTSSLQQYAVESTWGLYSHRLGPYLIPFAELFAGDMLCFNFTKVGTPDIVVWFHEEGSAEHPYTEVVADSFSEFLPMLFTKDDFPPAIGKRSSRKATPKAAPPVARRTKRTTKQK